jgi:hypothetical protein
MGRDLTPKPVEAHSKARCHDGFAKAGDLEWLLLQPWQHKMATRSATAAPKSGAAEFFKR